MSNQQAIRFDDLAVQVKAEIEETSVMPKVWALIHDNREEVVSHMGFTTSDEYTISQLGLHQASRVHYIQKVLEPYGFDFQYDGPNYEQSIRIFKLVNYDLTSR